MRQEECAYEEEKKCIEEHRATYIKGFYNNPFNCIAAYFINQTNTYLNIIESNIC